MDTHTLGELVIDGAERALWPDPLIRWGIRRICERRLEEARLDERLRRGAADLQRRLREGPITVEAPAANQQHYEVPTAFYKAVLGPHLKYSCGYWPAGVSTLEQSERAMLELTLERAEVQDGMRVLDLGCGWGSFTLYLAERLRGCRVTAVSNSATQRAFIEGECRARGLGNVEVLTEDVARFAPRDRFDRVVSVEMMEHVRNHRELLRRIERWLLPGGKLFVHIFCHRQFAYLYEDQGADDWMSRHFFTGGMMPSFDWLPQIAEAAEDAPVLQTRWPVAGRHYAHTSNAWLAQLDERRQEVLRAFEAPGPGGGLSPTEAARQLQRWRIFFMACAELFDYGGGGEWFVGHYLFRRRGG